MESQPDTCPNCHATEYDTIHTFLGSYNVECGECEHVWNLREQLGLSKDRCECCGNTLTWGCGHTYEQEAATVQHRLTTDHLLGDCDCYVSRSGYIAYFTREQRRDNIAAVLRALTHPDGTGSVEELEEMLFARP